MSQSNIHQLSVYSEERATMQYAWPWGVTPTHRLRIDGRVPRISIITPNYNGAKFLEATIRSVICQGYPNLQYIVADGASTDGSLEIINRYKDYISIIISEPDRGHGDALNKGFAKADGDILAWLNSDDMYLPWTLQTVAEVFAEFPHVRWIEGLPAWWDAEGRLYGGYLGRPINQYDYLIGRYQWIQQESVFWTKELWNAVGASITQDFKYMVDGELWTRFFLHSPLHRVNYQLAGFRTHHTNRSHDQANVNQEMQRAIEIMRKRVDPSTRALANKFTRMQTLLTPIPSGAVRTGLFRVLAPSDCQKMGYEVISRNLDSWQIKTEPFR